MCSSSLATHSSVTKHFVAGTTHSAHVPWPNIRFMPLATFHHFSVYPCADLDYCTTVDVHATLFTQISIIFFGPFLHNIVTYVIRPLTADLFLSRLRILRILQFTSYFGFLSRDRYLKIALLQLRKFLRTLFEHIAKFNYRYQDIKVFHNFPLATLVSTRQTRARPYSPSRNRHFESIP